MIKLEDLYFDVLLKDGTDKEIAKLKKKLGNMGVKAKVTPKVSVADFRKAINAVSNSKVPLSLKLKHVKLTREALKTIQTDLDSRTWKLKRIEFGKVDTTKIETAIENAVRRGIGKGASGSGGGGNGGISASGFMSQFKNIFIGGFLTSFVKRAADTIGNFETQLVALKSILQSGMKGNNIFNQIKEFSVKSPFTFKELTDYAKQLTAFQIPYDELFDTTKRLADLSAGLGVDMGRIILAYGQVRSAAFLRGQELRQFTEAGIPMVQALADKFSELEGTVVSTGAVFDKISNREVSFNMVKEVIDDLTNEGGKFYKMQEKQAETLKGKIANLTDAYDVMLYTLGKSGIGTIMKFFVGMAGSIMECTKAVGAFVVAFAIGALVRGVIALATGIAKVAKALKLLSLWNPWAAVASAIATIAYLWSNVDDAYNEMVDNVHNRSNELLDEFKKLKDNIKGVKITFDEMESVKSVKAVIDKIKDVVSTELNDRLVARIYAQSGVKGQLDEAKQVVNEMENVAMAMKSMQGFDINNHHWINFFDEDAIADVKDYTKAIENLEGAYNEYNKARERAGKARVSILQYYYEQIKSPVDVVVKEIPNNYIPEATKELDELSRRFMAELMQKAPKLGRDERAALIDQMVEAWGEADDRLGKSEKLMFKIKLQLDANSAEKDITKKAPALMSAFLEEVDKEAVRLGDKMSDLISQASNGNKEAVKKIKDIYKAATDAASVSYGLFKNEFRSLYDYLKANPLEITIKTHYLGGEEVGGVETELRRRMINSVLGKGYYEGAVANPTKASSYGINNWLADKNNQWLSTLGKEVATYQDLKKAFDTEHNKLETEIKTRKSSKLDFSEQQAQLDLLTKAYKEFGWTPEEKGSNKPKSRGSDKWLEQKRKEISLLEKYISTYKKLLETYGKAEALDRLDKLTEFSSLRDKEGRYIYDPTDGAGALRKFLNSVKPMTTTAERKSFWESIGIKAENRETDEEQQKSREAMEKLREAITENTSRWATYRKLLDSTGNKSVAETLAFGHGIGSLSNQSEELYAELVDDLAKAGYKGSVESLKGKTKTELAEMNIGEGLSSKLGEYFKVAEKEREDALDLTVKAIEHAMSLNDQISKINGKADRAIEAINNSDITSEQKQKLTDDQNRQRRIEIAKATWEDFKKSDDYVKVFDNLDRMSVKSIEGLYGTLIQKQPFVTDDATSMKALRDALDKLRTEIEKRNPFGTLKDSFNIMSVLSGIKDGDLVRTEAQSRIFGKAKGQKITQKDIDDAWADNGIRLVNSLKGVTNAFNAMESFLKPVCDLFEQLGDTDLSDIFGIGGNAFSTATGIAGSFSTLSQTFDGKFGKALGTAGPWGVAVGAGLSVVTSIFALHDKAIQKEIEASEQRQKEMENLTKNLESLLKNTMGGVYGWKAPQSMVNKLDMSPKSMNDGITAYIEYLKKANTYSKATKDAIKEAQSNDWNYYDTAYASLLAQRDEAQKQYELENDKKKKDKNAIEDAKQEVYELDQQIEQFAKDMASDLYGIDFKSWAGDLASALVDAWASGSDAAKAYKDTINGILKQVATSVIQQSIIEQALQPVMDSFLKQFAADKGKITDAGFEILTKLYSTTEEATKSAFDVLDKWNEIVKKNGGEGLKDSEASSLSSNIKNITEETADLLVSYVNSIRADVAYKRQIETQILDVVNGIPEMNSIANSQLTQLRAIAGFTQRNAEAAEQIKSSLDKVVYLGTNGYRIRV